MSEKAPKKPEKVLSLESFHEEEKINPRSILDQQNLIFGDIDTRSIKLTGESVRAIKALNAAYANVMHLEKIKQETGPAYFLYTRALREIVDEPGFWDAQKNLNGDEDAETFRAQLLEDLSLHEDSLSDTFKFTGSKQ